MYQSGYLGLWLPWNRAQGGYSQKKLGGGVWPASQIPTLFMTKIYDFSYLIMANTADTVSLNIVYARILLLVLSAMMKKQLLLKNIVDWKLDCKNNIVPYLWPKSIPYSQ